MIPDFQTIMLPFLKIFKMEENTLQKKFLKFLPKSLILLRKTLKNICQVEVKEHSIIEFIGLKLI